jgi:hypothetical protein
VTGDVKNGGVILPFPHTFYGLLLN